MTEITPKTPQELGISDAEWVDLAESLMISREFVSLLSEGPLYCLHRMQVDYLEEFFGLKNNQPAVERIGLSADLDPPAGS